MSVEAPKTVEETAPVESKPVEQLEATPAVPSETPTAAETSKPVTTETPATADATTTPAVGEETKPVEETLKKDEAVVEAVPASEGTLGYKAPGFLKQFHFSKHFFWFSEEPLTTDALNVYSRSEKASHAHKAWARESGKGLLFHSKRAEDKAHPAGIIALYDIGSITKDGMHLFSFEDSHGKTHKFEATSTTERDSWVVALEKQKEEGKSLKEELTGRDSYKKNIEDYSKPAITATPAVAASRSKSKDPKKSLDANTATTAATTTPADTTELKKETSPDAATTTPVAPVEEKKDTTKSRSQSRKRASVFGSFLKKDEAKEEKKAAEKAEKHEKQEEKKVEAEAKKEEAKQEHSVPKATEAAGAAAIAAAPVAAVSADKKEEKTEPTSEAPVTEPTTATPTTEPTATPSTTDKKAKRGSVFGSLFNKAKVTSPTSEKTEKEVGPTPPAKDEVLPVSDTAPKVDEPIDTKPLDTAAITAPATTDAPAETPKETTATRPAATEKKSFLGFIKKPESKKDEVKETKAADVKPTESTTAAVPAVDGADAPVTTDAAAKSDSETPVEEKKTPADKDQRRSSLFGGLGTIKNKKRDETEPTENGTEKKREKSPLPSKIGGLFQPKEEVKTETSAPAATSEPATAAETKTDVPASTDAPESKIIGDVVPEAVVAAPTPAPEVKASA
ncbi:uncharacterized protein AB675_6177 [Cyphellophora attinorum]|uniref:PH domain-containing protein n=1 Tax=Cyphellophora attinorum TaxID=1664694 RepID=A0A0N0NQC3_9EURO|nr:uncharacterized protein AB675_6177 [Phialophora attinorum]KPI43741.1 hypothetical protein AB675_6177 [Phialophora attinorum]